MKIVPLIWFTFFFLSSFFSLAQKTTHVKGFSQVRIENNMSKEQAREKAKELAQINAIESAFGTLVAQDADIRVNDGKVKYNIIGTTRVKGEWIKTKSIRYIDNTEDVKTGSTQETIIWVTCTIEGEARELRGSINLEAFTLRCPDLNCRTESFEKNESFYMYIMSPVDGYLSVYIEEEEVTRRLFPYMDRGNESAVKIKADMPYYLFTTDKALNRLEMRADPIILYTDKPNEYNTIYVVFSPEAYSKPILTEATRLDDGSILPKALNNDKFQDWLTDCKVAMPDFQDKSIKISISKNR